MVLSGLRAYLIQIQDGNILIVVFRLCLSRPIITVSADLADNLFTCEKVIAREIWGVLGWPLELPWDIVRGDSQVATLYEPSCCTCSRGIDHHHWIETEWKGGNVNSPDSNVRKVHWLWEAAKQIIHGDRKTKIRVRPGSKFLRSFDRNAQGQRELRWQERPILEENHLCIILLIKHSTCPNIFSN